MNIRGDEASGVTALRNTSRPERKALARDSPSVAGKGVSLEQSSDAMPQYSSASMIVITRWVTAGSAGSGDRQVNALS